MDVIDGGADHSRILERVRIFLAAAAEPFDQFRDSPNARGRLELILASSDPLTDPGKIQKFHFDPRPAANGLLIP
jgi:hypothetical protein